MRKHLGSQCRVDSYLVRSYNDCCDAVVIFSLMFSRAHEAFRGFDLHVQLTLDHGQLPRYLKGIKVQQLQLLRCPGNNWNRLRIEVHRGLGTTLAFLLQMFPELLQSREANTTYCALDETQ
jgi:hypothetical protein